VRAKNGGRVFGFAVRVGGVGADHSRRGGTMTVVLDLWTIQVLDSNRVGSPLPDPDRVAALMAEVEENLNLLLPSGCIVRVRKWDDLDERNDDE
jgi:hypothetical protein